jgi:hypothetical protein
MTSRIKNGWRQRMARLEDIIGKDYRITGYGRYLKTYEHDSLVIDTERQVFYWNSKEISGDVYDWLTRVKGLTRAETREYLKEHSPDYLEYLQNVVTKEQKDVVVSERLVSSFYNLGKKHREYWKDVRGYTDATIDLFQLGYTGFWYTIPIFVGGKFRNFQCRHPEGYQKVWYKHMGPLPFNLDYVKNKSWFCLTEGPPDAIMLMQHGIPAMSSTVGGGYFNPTWITKMSHAERIYIVYDNDKAGRKGVARAGEQIGNVAKVFTFDGYPEKYDVTDYFKDGGSARELKEKLKNDSKYWFEVEQGMDFERRQPHLSQQR